MEGKLLGEKELKLECTRMLHESLADSDSDLRKWNHGIEDAGKVEDNSGADG